MDITSKIVAQAIFKLGQLIDNKQRFYQTKPNDFLELEIEKMKFILEVIAGMNTLFAELTKQTDFQERIIDAIAIQQEKKMFTKPSGDE